MGETLQDCLRVAESIENENGNIGRASLLGSAADALDAKDAKIAKLKADNDAIFQPGGYDYFSKRRDELQQEVYRLNNATDMLVKERKQLEADLAEARGVVAMMPLTADKVRVVELDGPVFAVRKFRTINEPLPYGYDIVECVVVFDTQQQVRWQGWWLGEFGDQAWFPLSDCYAIRDNAEAAQAAASGGGA